MATGAGRVALRFGSAIGDIGKAETGMNSVEYVASILKREGVAWMACYPSNPLIEAVAKEGIRPVAFRHERGAVMAADGYSRHQSDRKRFGVVMRCKSQAGAENSVGGLGAGARRPRTHARVLPGGNRLDHGERATPNFFTATYSVAERVVKHAEVHREARADRQR